jgi:RimJ/RimL family protein N-acetyltransferase
VIEPAIRKAGIDDAELAADLMTASYPALAQDPVITRYRWEHPRDGYEAARYIAELDGHPVALLTWIHGPWAMLPDRHCEVEVYLDQKHLDPGLLDFLWTWIERQAVDTGAKLLLAYAVEDEDEMRASISRLGYVLDRSEKVWELDLAANGARLVAEAIEARQMAARGGVELLTMAAWKDPDRIRKLYELDERTRQDIPHSLPILPESLADFERRTSAPDRPHDRYWIALHQDLPVALSYLRFPPVRGSVWTGYTCSHPDYRGRGLARGVKLQSLAQAVELRIPLVYTDNDSENAPMLHINERLGYRRRPGFVGHLKRVITER